jgi:hypothetical protein
MNQAPVHPLRSFNRFTLGRCALGALIVAAITFAISLRSTPNAQADEKPASSESATDDYFRSKVVPFVQKYCSDCHGADEPEAGLALTEFKDATAFIKARKAWRLAGDKIRAGEMPPADHDPRPKAKDAAAIGEWIEAELARSVCSGPINPGRVTIRRLNRAEYNNTIRDLVGVDFKPADDFPSDDVGYGFDNIGDVLSMPSILLEKYLAAAETIMEKAIVVDNSDKAPTQRVLGARLEGAGSPAEEDARVFPSEGNASIRVDLPREGEYLLTVQASGDQAGPELVQMAVRLDDADLKQFEVANQHHNPIAYKTKFRASSAAAKKITVAFLNDFYKTKDQVEKGQKYGDRNLYVHYVEVQGPLGLDPDTLPDSHKRIMICTPPSDRPIIIRPRRRPMTDEEREAARKRREESRREAEQQRALQAKSRVDCARQIIAQFAERAFRRPVGDDEVERLMAFWQMCEKEGQPFERGIQVALTAVLVSPHFLYRIEGEPTADSADNIYSLNDFELAARLSYFLWSTMPDAELYTHAKQGTLRQNDNLDNQIRRMLRDPKAQALVDNFGGQWLQTRRLSGMTP